MTETQLTETKERILQAARQLFAAKGYEATSVREIAATADVNVAAVNYHFTSKEKLLVHVINTVFAQTTQDIRARRAQHPSERVEDLAVWIFGYFLDSADVLRSVFRMMLSEKGLEFEPGGVREEEKYGPPGGLALAHAISVQLKLEIPEVDLFWAVKTIFSNVVHLALMYSNHFCKMPSEMPYFDRPHLEKDIRRLVQVVLQDLARVTDG